MTQTSTRPPAAGLRPAVGANATARGDVRPGGNADAAVRAEPPAAPDTAPPRIGSWMLRRLVRESALARVFRVSPAAIAPSSSPPDGEGDYALKLLRPEQEDRAEAVRCWRREAEAGSLINHPRLLPVLAAHVSCPPYYIVTPWLHGATLAERLAAGWRPGLAAALWIARQTAEALAALDAAGWMHGDVKPDNVHISPRGRVTLIDLGFARPAADRLSRASRGNEPRTWLDRLVLGTAAYLAPEAAGSAGGADIRADLYGLGVMLFELLAGRLPFEEQEPGELLRRHCALRPPRLRRFVPAAPREVDAFVRSLLAKQPLRRPQSPSEVVRRLASLEVAAFAARG